MSCRVQDGAKVANDGSKRKPQTQFPSRRMSGHCDWRSSSGFLYWLSTSATPPGDRETGRGRSHGTPPGTEGGNRNVHSPGRSSRWRLFASTRNGQSAPTVPPTATTVPGGRTEGNNGTGSPPKGTTVPSGKPEDRSRTDGPPQRRRSCQVESQKQGRLNKKTAGLCSPAVLKLIALILT